MDLETQQIAIRDLVLSGLVYVILTYLTFRLMRHRRRPNNDDEDGGNQFELTPPKIDLPPGIGWPVDGSSMKKEAEEEVLA